DGSIDAKAATGRYFNGQHSDVAADGEAAKHRIVGGRRHQSGPDSDPLTIVAGDETRLATPDGRPQAAVVSHNSDREEPLPFQERQRSFNDSRRHAGADPTREVAFSGAFLHRNFAFVKWLVVHARSPAVRLKPDTTYVKTSESNSRRRRMRPSSEARVCP